MTEDFVIKYLWSAVGYGLMSIPILFPSAVLPLNLPSAKSSSQNQVAMRTESQ
jgi:ATP-binding cassette subfamily D (ALD) long-chain fatty acid import protein